MMSVDEVQAFCAGRDGEPSRCSTRAELAAWLREHVVLRRAWWLAFMMGFALGAGVSLW